MLDSDNDALKRLALLAKLQMFRQNDRFFVKMAVI